MKKILKSLSVAWMAALTLSLNTIAQTVQDGLRHLDAERYNAAGDVFGKLVASAPTAENYFYQGYYYLNLPEPDLAKAKEAFEKGTALDAKRPDPICRVGLGTVKLLSGDRAGAKADFDLIKKDTKNKNSDVLFRIGEAYTLSEKINDPAEAVSNIDAALLLQKVKNNPDYYIALSQAYYIKNDGGPAMTALENALRMGQKAAKINTLMARVWYQGKSYQRMKELLDAAIAADADHAPAYDFLAKLFTTFGNYKSAAKYAELYLQKSDADDKAKLRYVKLAFSIKDYEGTLKVVNELKGKIKDPIIYRLEGFSLFELGKCADAIPLIQKFISEAEKERILPLDYGYLGRAYSCVKDDANKKANDSLGIVYMEKAIELGDTTYNYADAIAVNYKNSKQWAKAAGVYQKVIEKSKKPTGTDYFNLASALYNARDWKAAEAAYAKVCEAYKDTWAPPYLSRARAAQYANQSDSVYVATFAAAPLYEAYLAVLKDKDKETAAGKKGAAEALGYLGTKALLIDKDIPKATNLLNEALKYDPTNANVQKVLQSITGGGAAPGTPPAPNNGSGGTGANPK
ncbi:MAG: tetratricopeptide repeat protein [Spirosomataceae bacterium]